MPETLNLFLKKDQVGEGFNNLEKVRVIVLSWSECSVSVQPLDFHCFLHRHSMFPCHTSFRLFTTVYVCKHQRNRKVQDLTLNYSCYHTAEKQSTNNRLIY